MEMPVIGHIICPHCGAKISFMVAKGPPSVCPYCGKSLEKVEPEKPVPPPPTGAEVEVEHPPGVTAPTPKFGWKEYVKWKEIRDALGDWKIRVSFRAVVRVRFTINLNWIRDLIAQGVAYFLNLLLNVVLFSLGWVAVFITVLIWAIVVVLAPLLKPLFRVWADLLKKGLQVDIKDPGSVWRPLSQLLWIAVPKWAGSMVDAIWKDIEKIYAEIPGALQALEDVRAYLNATVFVALLQHLGVGPPIVAGIKGVVQFAYDIIDWLYEKLNWLEEWVKSKLGVFWWVVSDLVESVFDELRHALDRLRALYIDPILDTINEIDLIAGMWIDEKTHIRPGLFKFVLGRAFATVVNSIARAYGVLDNLNKLLESYRARQELEKKRVDDNEDTLAVMFDSTLTNEELARMQASPVMRDIDRVTEQIEKYVAGEKIPQGNDIDKTEEEISGTVG